MSPRFYLASGALLAAMAVTAGAVGTHFLKESLKLPEAELETYEVAVRYQMYHALGLIAVGLLALRGGSRLLASAGAAFLLGIVLFSGGIYAWLLTDIKPFIRVVPIGGMAFIVGWLLLAASTWGLPADRAGPP